MTCRLKDLKQFAFDLICENRDAIAFVGDKIFYFGELGMQEFETTRFLRQLYEKAGFNFTSNLAGMPTAWVAAYGSGKPVIAILAEFDALPGGYQSPGIPVYKPLIEGAPGHMEGHNTMAAVCIGASYAIKKTMERNKLLGTLLVFGGPAEEQLISRPHLVSGDFFKNVDVALSVHIYETMQTVKNLATLSAISALFSFKGGSSHAAASPWEGRDALDAVELMSIGIDKLRKHFKGNMQRVFTSCGDQPNVIPERSGIWWFLRDLMPDNVIDLYKTVTDVANGAALMSRTIIEAEILGSAWPFLANSVLADTVYENMQLVGMPEWTREEVSLAKKLQSNLGKKPIGLKKDLGPIVENDPLLVSTDAGDVSWVVPTAVIYFPGNIPGVIPHHWSAGVAPATSIAHKGEVAGAKVLTGTILDLFINPNLVKKSKTKFIRDTAGRKYFSLLPIDAKPPLDLNRTTMEKYRPNMSTFYLDNDVNFICKGG